MYTHHFCVGGLEKTFATNIVSNVILTDGLVPSLQKSQHPKVILVSSGGALTERLCVTDAAYQEGGYDGTVFYARTKRMQVVLAHYYARRFPNIFWASMHPGWSVTPGVKTAMPDFVASYGGSFRTAAQGADTIVWLAIHGPSLPNGAFWRDRQVELEHFWLSGTSYPESQEVVLYDWLKSKAAPVNE